jgi:hypothetical protein
MPIAYWISEKVSSAFSLGEKLSSIAKPRQGLATGNNDEFLREWFECDFTKIGFSFSDNDSFQKSGFRYAPYNKGGGFKKWYGNLDLVIKFDRDSYLALQSQGNHLPSRQLYFHEGLTWSAMGNVFGMRYSPTGSVFDTKGATCFVNEREKLFYVMAFMNSAIASNLLKIVSPTLDFNPGPISLLPVVYQSNDKQLIDHIVSENIAISKQDYDSFEISWDFKKHVLIKGVTNMGRLIKERFDEWEKESNERFSLVKKNEEELNKIFIDIYHFQDEVTPDVKDCDISIRLANRNREIRSLISYFIGLLMGRYSLETDGLVFAGGPFDYRKYGDYVDKDGVLPIFHFVGIDGGLTGMICELIKRVYGNDTYQDNLDYIADSLGKKHNESSIETINRYLNEEFYQDHVKIYQKRPIYWLFSSGKEGAFECLLYIHRYTPNTLALINTKYFLPRTALYKSEIERLEGQLRTNGIDAKTTKMIEAELEKAKSSQQELFEYGQVLDHMANQFIKLDLDDGVKANYEKFQNVTVEMNGQTIKKDLLAPIK